MKVESGAADGGAIEHFLHGHFFDGFLKNQREESVTETNARAPGADIGFAPLSSRFASCCYVPAMLWGPFRDIDGLFVQQPGTRSRPAILDPTVRIM